MSKICHISYADKKGGAAIAAFRLHDGLRYLGYESSMLVREKITSRNDVAQLNIKQSKSSDFVSSRLLRDNLLYKIIFDKTNVCNTVFALPYPGLDITQLPLIKDSSVINLHWVSYIFSPNTLAKLKELNKPIVWTLHDQNPMTGGCHYTAGCEEFKKACEFCPQLKNGGYGLTNSLVEEKFEAIRGLNLTIVSPSKWLADCARESKMFRDFPVYEIPYSLDLNIYNNNQRAEARSSLGIEEKTFCFLFTAHGLNEGRKGFHIMLSALQKCLEEEDFRQAYENKKIRFLAMGEPNSQLDEYGIEYTALGYIKDEQKISEIYSSADTLLLPSIEDNYPNVMIEALACGLPIIGFNIGGLKDLVSKYNFGFLVSEFNSSEMAEAICKMYRQPDLRKEISVRARNFMEKTHSLEIQPKKYLELYSQLCKVSPDYFLNNNTSDNNFSLNTNVVEDHSIGTNFWRKEQEERIFTQNFPSLIRQEAAKASGEYSHQIKEYDYSTSTVISFGGQGNYHLYGIPPFRYESLDASDIGFQPLYTTLRFKPWRYHIVFHAIFCTDANIDQSVDIFCAGDKIATFNYSDIGEYEEFFSVPKNCIKRSSQEGHILDLKVVTRTLSNYGLAKLKIKYLTVLDLLEVSRNKHKQNNDLVLGNIQIPNKEPTAFAVYEEGWYDVEFYENTYVRWLGPSLSAKMSIVGDLLASTICIVYLVASNIGNSYKQTKLIIGENEFLPLKIIETENNKCLIYSIEQQVDSNDSEYSTVDSFNLEVTRNYSPSEHGSSDKRKFSILVNKVVFYNLNNEELSMFD